MLLDEIIYECEVVYEDEDGNVLNEAAVRQYRRYGNKMVKKYRCLAGAKKGKLVAEPGGCATRRDPKKVRQGRKVMRSKKGIIARKTKVSKRKSVSRLVTKMNQRLMGNRKR